LHGCSSFLVIKDKEREHARREEGKKGEARGRKITPNKKDAVSKKPTHKINCLL
jgi:hypothetical protein